MGAQMSKREALLRILKWTAMGGGRNDGWVGQYNMMRAGGMRYGARLWELRRLGWRIEAKNLSGGEWQYRLIGRVRVRNG